MASESSQTSTCIVGADSGVVSVANTSTLLAHATIDADPTSTYPRRKLLLITNNSTAHAVFIKFGSAPTATSDYHVVLNYCQGTVDTAAYIPPGSMLLDASVPQDNVYAITASSTASVDVLVGV